MMTGRYWNTWVSLDEGDNDPARFLAYFVAALQAIHEGVGEVTLAALQSPQPPVIEVVLTALINEIVAVSQGDHEGRPYVLVLDDYHLITAQPIHEALTFLLGHLPPQMHLVIISRQDPPFPLPRLRGRGQVTEMCQNDLRFTFEDKSALTSSRQILEHLQHANLFVVPLDEGLATYLNTTPAPQLAAQYVHYVIIALGFGMTFRMLSHFCSLFIVSLFIGTKFPMRLLC